MKYLIELYTKRELSFKKSKKCYWHFYGQWQTKKNVRVTIHSAKDGLFHYYHESSYSNDKTYTIDCSVSYRFVSFVPDKIIFKLKDATDNDERLRLLPLFINAPNRIRRAAIRELE